MNKSEILKVLLEQHNSVETSKAYILFKQDHEGDMVEREKLLNNRFHQQYAIGVTAQSLLGDKMYKTFKSECISITETRWYKTRKYNYNGTPLSERQIETRDWAIQRAS
jgi:hypothetical protein